VVAETITGFCEAEVNEFGPVQPYTGLPPAVAVKLKSLPVQIGELLPATGAAGEGIIVTLTVPGALGGQPGAMDETEYVPAARVETEGMDGF